MSVKAGLLRSDFLQGWPLMLWLGFIWLAGLSWALVCAVGSAVANVHFYASLAITPFEIAVLTLLGAAFEAGLIALLPVSERVRRAGDEKTANWLRAFWIACLASSFVAALGFYAVALWEAQQPKASSERAQIMTSAQITEAERELRTLDTPEPPRPVEELDALIAASLARPAIDADGNPRRISLDRATNGCAPGTGGRAFRDQCPEVLSLRAERGKAARKVELQTTLERNREVLKTANVETASGLHPLFGLLSRVTGIAEAGAVLQLVFLILISVLTVASAGLGPHLLLDALHVVTKAERDARAAAAKPDDEDKPDEHDTSDDDDAKGDDDNAGDDDTNGDDDDRGGGDDDADNGDDDTTGDDDTKGDDDTSDDDRQGDQGDDGARGDLNRPANDSGGSSGSSLLDRGMDRLKGRLSRFRDRLAGV